MHPLCNKLELGYSSEIGTIDYRIVSGLLQIQEGIKLIVCDCISMNILQGLFSMELLIWL